MERPRRPAIESMLENIHAFSMDTKAILVLMSKEPIDKESLSEMASVVSGSYFDDFRPALHRYLRLSRNAKFMSDPVNHLSLQLAILAALEEGDDAIRRGRQLVREKGDQQHIHNIRNQHLNIAFRTIADGIAWRTLGFNRFHLRILSQARSPGAADNKDGRIAEIEMAKRVAESGDLVLFNDTTNILRVSDLIFIPLKEKSRRLYLAEMKLHRNKIVLNSAKSIMEKVESGKGISKQEKRLLQAQMAIFRNEFPLAGRPTAPVLETNPGRVKNYMRKVNKMVTTAAKEGSAEGFVSKYMYVSAVDLTYFKKGVKDEKGGSKAPTDLEPLIMWNSYETMAILKEREVARSSAPYTTFPFSVPNVIKLVLGEMLLQVAIYKQPLIDEFKRLGWDLIFDEDEFEKYEVETHEDKVKHFSNEILFPDEGFKGNRILWLSNPKTGFKWPVHQFIVQMMHEFITAEYIVALAEQIMNAATPGKMNAFYVVDNNDVGRWK